MLKWWRESAGMSTIDNILYGKFGPEAFGCLCIIKKILADSEHLAVRRSVLQAATDATDAVLDELVKLGYLVVSGKAKDLLACPILDEAFDQMKNKTAGAADRKRRQRARDMQKGSTPPKTQDQEEEVNLDRDLHQSRDVTRDMAELPPAILGKPKAECAIIEPDSEVQETIEYDDEPVELGTEFILDGDGNTIDLDALIRSSAI